MAKKVIFGITWTWKKVLALAAGLLGIGTLTSCYGMPITGPDPIPEDEYYTYEDDGVREITCSDSYTSVLVDE